MSAYRPTGQTRTSELDDTTTETIGWRIEQGNTHSAIAAGVASILQVVMNDTTIEYEVIIVSWYSQVHAKLRKTVSEARTIAKSDNAKQRTTDRMHASTIHAEIWSSGICVLSVRSRLCRSIPSRTCTCRSYSDTDLMKCSCNASEGIWGGKESNNISPSYEKR
jgi:hypothetical protein